MSSGDVPTIDLEEWKNADAARRSEMALALDSSLRQTGLFLLRGHGVPADLSKELRQCGRAFFALSDNQKSSYSVQAAYDNGWRGLGLITSSVSEGCESPPDLHEAIYMGPAYRTGRPEFDALYYPDNRWPTEVPGLEEASRRYARHMVRVAHEVLTILADVLGIPSTFFTSQARRATWTQCVNWYPSLRTVGSVEPGQMRVGPHCDFGTLSLLDRQQGVGGLEIWNSRDGWHRPPFDPGALTVNLGDLMHVWTDGRWRSLRHRVLPPAPEAPDEELFSLVFFFEADPEAVVAPLAQPAGGGCGLRSLVAGKSMLEKVGAINAPS
jgi:validamycin A dioxygenase